MTRYRTFIKIVLLFSFINNNEINQQKNKKKNNDKPKGKIISLYTFFLFWRFQTLLSENPSDSLKNLNYE